MLSSLGLFGPKGQIVPKGRSPFTPWGNQAPVLESYHHLICQSICHPPHSSACQLYKSPEQRTWDLATPDLSLAAPTFAAFTWFYPEPMPFSPSAPTLAKPILFPENGSPINPAGTLIDSLMFNSYYIGRKNQVSESFSRNRNSRFCDRGRENTRQACMQHCAVTESEGVLKKQGRNEVLKWATNRKSYKWWKQNNLSQNETYCWLVSIIKNEYMRTLGNDSANT